MWTPTIPCGRQMYGRVCFDMNFLFVSEKITILLFERNKPIRKILLKDILSYKIVDRLSK